MVHFYFWLLGGALLFLVTGGCAFIFGYCMGTHLSLVKLVVHFYLRLRKWCTFYLWLQEWCIYIFGDMSGALFI